MYYTLACSEYITSFIDLVGATHFLLILHVIEIIPMDDLFVHVCSVFLFENLIGC